MEEMEFEGDELTWHEGMTVTCGDPGDDGEPLEMLSRFVLNDVSGEYTMTAPVSFEI